MKEVKVVGRIKGTKDWITLEEVRDTKGNLQGYRVDTGEYEGSFRKYNFYLIDQVVLKEYTDLSKLRIEIAKNALYAIIRDKSNLQTGSTVRIQTDAEEAVAYADALIDELRKEKSK